MTSNSQLKRKNIDLKMENSNLIDLRYALMSDNRRLERERNELQTMLDLSAQALDAAIQERDEARTWARRMMRERDEALEALRKEKSKVNYTFQLGVIDPYKFCQWSEDD